MLNWLQKKYLIDTVLFQVTITKKTIKKTEIKDICPETPDMNDYMLKNKMFTTDEMPSLYMPKNNTN